MGGTCSAHGRYATTLWLQGLREETTRKTCVCVCVCVCVCRRSDNIKMNLRKTLLEGVDWIHLAHDRARRQDLVNTVTRLVVP
jgi:hypothetical protein